MKLNELRDKEGATHSKKRLGRGIGSGSGKTAGRGVKGQKARSGVAINGFEGGQMPLYRRLPKRGFLPYGGKTEFAIVNVGELAARFAKGSVIDPDALASSGLIRKSGRAAVKVLGDGDVAHALTVRVHKVSESAKQKLEAAGGRVEVLPARVKAEGAAK
jgi:large subunit ribosomal protein L15